MKYFPLESESASFSLTPHLQHPKASSLLLFSFGTGERKEEKQERDRRDKVKFLRNAVFLVQASFLMPVQIKPAILHIIY